MSFSDSYMLDLGWLFFTAWGILVGVVSVAAFRNDLFPADRKTDSVPPSNLQKTQVSK
ncbi:MAG TPA: hypothetical protein VKV39_14090 [Candidatus Sulfotelmatobacter sp.]|nr:hypothetical protein [Candidatus Sulfotelmatobacter sp.]